jgi:hypothetical protein
MKVTRAVIEHGSREGVLLRRHGVDESREGIRATASPTAFDRSQGSWCGK